MGLHLRRRQPVDQAVFTPNSTDPDGLTAQNLQYVYDAAGNRISETVNGVTTTYVVNNVNEYTSSTTNGVTTTYQYDADGNLIAQTTGSSTTSYTFNELNQLTAVKRARGYSQLRLRPVRQPHFADGKWPADQLSRSTPCLVGS